VSRVAGLIALACAFAALTVPAAAHAVLEASDPAAGAEVARPPQTVTLMFDEPVETSLGSVRIVGADGRQRPSGAVIHPDGDPTRVAVRAPPLARGRYIVTWQVVSADSHVVGGAYAFGVGVPAGAPPPLERDPGATILATVVHFALLAAALLAVGLPIGALALGRAGGAAGKPAGAVEFGAWLVVVVAAFADVALRAQLNGGTLGASFATHVGAMRSVAMVAGGVGIVSLTRRRRVWALFVPAAAAVLLSLSLGGHAARGTLPALGVAADALHLVAAAAWIGVLGVGLTVGASAVLQRISPVATIAVATIVLSGAVQTIRNVGAWQPLIATAYGRAIDLKVALLIGALGLAWSARRSLARAQFALRRRLTVELGILAAVVGVTAVLIDLPLAHDVTAGRPPASVASSLRPWKPATASGPKMLCGISIERWKPR